VSKRKTPNSTTHDALSLIKLTFATQEKIRTLYQRFGAQLLEDRQALEHGLSIGRMVCGSR
jgi:hypothetical protein